MSPIFSSIGSIAVHVITIQMLILIYRDGLYRDPCLLSCLDQLLLLLLFGLLLLLSSDLFTHIELTLIGISGSDTGIIANTTTIDEEEEEDKAHCYESINEEL